MLSHKKNFNLAEVTFAIGISIVALTVLIGLLPLGIRSSSNAIATDLSSQLINGFADYIVESHDFDTLEGFTYADAHPATPPVVGDYQTENSAGSLFGESIYPHKSDPQFYHLASKIGDTELTALNAEIRLWTANAKHYSEDVVLGFSSRRSGNGGETLATSGVTTLYIEASWPITEVIYSKRKKLTLMRDITD